MLHQRGIVCNSLLSVLDLPYRNHQCSCLLNNIMKSLYRIELGIRIIQYKPLTLIFLPSGDGST